MIVKRSFFYLGTTFKGSIYIIGGRTNVKLKGYEGRNYISYQYSEVSKRITTNRIKSFQSSIH